MTGFRIDKHSILEGDMENDQFFKSIIPNLDQLAKENTLPVVVSAQFKRAVNERPRIPAGTTTGGQFSRGGL